VLSLSFDYSLFVAPDNEDYLVVIVDYNTTPFELEVGRYNSSQSDDLIFSGSHSINLSLFQNRTISLAFGN
jgi:hypothetical protein